jgi:glycosyltransferase involved in cell wall biosynthesis
MTVAGARPRPLRRHLAGAALVHYPLTIELPRTPLPKVVTLHDVQHLDLPEMFPRLERRFRGVFWHRALRRADRIVAISAFVRDRLVETQRIDPSRIRVTPLGLDHDLLRPPAAGEREPILLNPARGWPHKNHARLFEAFALLRRERPDARLLLVGATGERFDLDRRLERLGLDDAAIVREPYVPEERLWSLMAACDVLVNLRSPTMGETSGAVIRGLGLGKPMLVSDVGWFAELPDDVALKIPVDEYEVRTIAGALDLAVDHAAELGAASREYVRREHDLGRSADGYVRALEEAAGGEAVANVVLHRIAEAAADVGLEDAGELAREARRAGIL